MLLSIYSNCLWFFPNSVWNLGVHFCSFSWVVSRAFFTLTVCYLLLIVSIFLFFKKRYSHDVLSNFLFKAGLPRVYGSCLLSYLFSFCVILHWDRGFCLFGFKVLVVFRTKYLGHISKYWVHFLFANSGITRLPWDQNYLMDLWIEDDFQFLCFFFMRLREWHPLSYLNSRSETWSLWLQSLMMNCWLL